MASDTEQGHVSGSQLMGKRLPEADMDEVCTQTKTVIARDAVAGPTPTDPANAVAPRWARFMVFVMLTQVVQMFMSFDGGSTPAVLDTIQKEMNNSWTEAEFGLLGSMDKFGTMAASIFWGRLLQLFNAKILLGFGLALNAAATAGFGIWKSKWAMQGMKFAAGATQALQGVWATVWTVSMAPPQSRTMWLGMGGVSAGFGNGIGTAVAGFGTANGLPYAFAFEFQAAVLAVLLVFQCLVPARWLVTHVPGTDVDEDPEAAEPFAEGEAPPKKQLGIWPQLRDNMRNKVFSWTAAAISVCMFVMSGIQFLWVRLFVEVWGLNKNAVTTVFLLVTGVGGGLGIAFGPPYIDKRGGFNAAPGVFKSLVILRRFAVMASFAGVLGIACMYGKLRSKDEGYFRQWGDHWLWMSWAAVFIMWMVHNASIAALCGINMEVVPPSMRTFASGLEITLRNVLGYAFGPLLPGLFMEALAKGYGWQPSTIPADRDWQLCCGFGFVCAFNFCSVLVLDRAVRAAQVVLTAKQAAALNRVQEALRAEKIVELERAMAAARLVDLHKTRDGEAVVGMANEAIGAYNAVGKAAFHGSIAFTATRAELQRSVAKLEHDLARLREENQLLRDRIGVKAHEEASDDAGAAGEAIHQPRHLRPHTRVMEVEERCVRGFGCCGENHGEGSAGSVINAAAHEKQMLSL